MNNENFNLNKIIEKLNNINCNFKKEILNEKNINNIYNIKSKYIGKKSFIKKLTNNLFNINQKKKIFLGNIINNIKKEIISLYNIKIININNFNNNLIKKYNINITFPTINNYIANLHPITILINKLRNIFNNIGFNIVDSIEIEDEYHNFDLLNFDYNHPSRNKKDTFWINKNLILRTHTTNIQTRINIEKYKIPIKLFSIGRVYRKDKDKTHMPMFYQIEGLYIDKNINLSNLKYFLKFIINLIFDNRKILTRIRLSYFPFTKPSIELDIYNENKKKWIEILGAGLIHNKILSNMNINNKLYSGFAFGIGLERLLMLKYNIENINTLYKNDIRFLKQFK